MKSLKILPIILCCTLLSGCWDKVEIDKKLFVSTIGVDAGQDIGKDKKLKDIGPSEPFGEMNMKKLKITYGFPDISELSPGKGGTAKEKDISVDAYSMEDAYNKTAARSSRTVHFGHTQLLLLSSDLMAYPDTVKEIVDYLQRQPSLNRTMQVAVADGSVEGYIKYQPLMEKNIESYISGVMENSSQNANVYPMSLNEFLMLLSENGNATVPRLSIDKDKNELKVNGVAIIKGFTLKGYLGPSETANLEILRGKLKGGKKVILYEGHPVDYNIDSLERRVVVSRRDDKLQFDLYIDIEGELKGYYVGKEFLSAKELKTIENDFNKAIAEECKKVIKTTQGKFGVDPIGLREYVEKYHPIIWNNIKDNWEQEYKQAVININVDTKIRRIGVVK